MGPGIFNLILIYITKPYPSPLSFRWVLLLFHRCVSTRPNASVQRQHKLRYYHTQQAQLRQDKSADSALYITTTQEIEAIMEDERQESMQARAYNFIPQSIYDSLSSEVKSKVDITVRFYLPSASRDSYHCGENVMNQIVEAIMEPYLSNDQFLGYMKKCVTEEDITPAEIEAYQRINGYRAFVVEEIEKCFAENSEN